MLAEEPSPLETQQGTDVMQTGSGTVFQNKILKKPAPVCVLPDVLHTRSIHVFFKFMNRITISTRYTISKNTSVVCHNPADYLKLQMS